MPLVYIKQATEAIDTDHIQHIELGPRKVQLTSGVAIRLSKEDFSKILDAKEDK